MTLPSVPEQLPAPPAASEVGPLARETAAAYRDLVESYKRHLKLTTAEAEARVNEPLGSVLEERAQNLPPDQVSWFDLHELQQRDPELALRRWEEIKQAALDELRSGHRAAVAMEVSGGSCWARAQFLAVRTDLAAQWQPRNGIEWQLIGAMAQAQTATHHWLTVLTAYTTLESAHRDREFREQGRWAAPRVSDAEAVEQAAAMVDRFNRIFLRTLRALHDLRRYASPVVVQNAKQVNIGNRQVNVAGQNQGPEHRKPHKASGGPAIAPGRNGSATLN